MFLEFVAEAVHFCRTDLLVQCGVNELKDIIVGSKRHNFLLQPLTCRQSPSTARTGTNHECRGRSNGHENLLFARLPTLAMRAFPVVDVRPIRSVDMAAAFSREGKNVELLVMVAALQIRAGYDLLAITVPESDVSGVGHLRAS